MLRVDVEPANMGLESCYHASAFDYHTVSMPWSANSFYRSLCIRQSIKAFLVPSFLACIRLQHLQLMFDEAFIVHFASLLNVFVVQCIYGCQSMPPPSHSIRIGCSAIRKGKHSRNEETVWFVCTDCVMFVYMCVHDRVSLFMVCPSFCIWVIHLKPLHIFLLLVTPR
jgi:hypothetical protein